MLSFEPGRSLEQVPVGIMKSFLMVAELFQIPRDTIEALFKGFNWFKLHAVPASIENISLSDIELNIFRNRFVALPSDHKKQMIAEFQASLNKTKMLVDKFKLFENLFTTYQLQIERFNKRAKVEAAEAATVAGVPAIAEAPAAEAAGEDLLVEGMQQLNVTENRGLLALGRLEQRRNNFVGFQLNLRGEETRALYASLEGLTQYRALSSFEERAHAMQAQINLLEEYARTTRNYSFAGVNQFLQRGNPRRRAHENVADRNSGESVRVTGDQNSRECVFHAKRRKKGSSIASQLRSSGARKDEKEHEGWESAKRRKFNG